MEIKQVFNDLVVKYKKETTSQIKFLDTFIVFSACVAALQAAYCFLVGTYPFNAFLSGFFCSLGCCVISVCFRMGLTSKEFENIDNNRIFGEYCFCILLLFLVVCNYLG